jgi:hypothetical protein
MMHLRPTWLVEVPTGPARALITLRAIPLTGAPSWSARITRKYPNYWLGCP